MFNPQSQANPSNNLSILSDDSAHIDYNKSDRHKTHLDDFHIHTPASQINLTAQQHFNNQTLHAYSAENLTLEENYSPSRRSRSLQSPALSRQFSQLDEFLKETYQKHGIYDLIRSFVDMEDKLVSTFENLKTTLQRKNYQESSKQKVRCFQEVNQMEELSFQAEENVIHDFLYNLQQFFVPSNVLGINQNQENQSENKPNDFSFSESKPYFQHNIISTKRSHIHNSRSKHAIGEALKSKKDLFTDEKMIKSINLLNKPVTPLKFDDLSLNKITEKSFKMTNSQILGQESIESEKMTEKGNQEELLKTIFELRQQILTLKQERYNLNGTFSHNSSFYFDRSLGEHNFRLRQLQNTGKEDSILDRLKEKQSFKLLNDYEAKVKDDDNDVKISLKSSTYPIVIQEENDSQVSGSGMGSFKLFNLQKIEVEDDKENNINIGNSQEYLYSKTTKFQVPSEGESVKMQNKKKNSSGIHLNLVEVTYSPESDCQAKQKNQVKEKYIRMSEERLNVMLSNLMDGVVGKFRRFFKVELEIQLVLLKLNRRRKLPDRRVEDSYCELIDWYSKLRVAENTKQQSVEKFLGVCLDKKIEMLEELQKINEKRL